MPWTETARREYRRDCPRFPSNPAWSSMTRAWVPGSTVLAISARWAFNACVSARGMTSRAAFPFVGQMAPKI